MLPTMEKVNNVNNGNIIKYLFTVGLALIVLWEGYLLSATSYSRYMTSPIALPPIVEILTPMNMTGFTSCLAHYHQRIPVNGPIILDFRCKTITNHVEYAYFHVIRYYLFVITRLLYIKDVYLLYLPM